MSTKFPGGFITKSPVAPTSTAASGIWTLDQQQQAQKAGTWPSPPMFIEDLFSTWLYTPAVSNEPITISNGIDLAGKGGMVWFKNRSISQNHSLVDTFRGGTNLLTPNLDAAAYTASIITAFNSNGFTTGTSSFVTAAPNNMVSWTFAEQPKFFDVVTYTGNGVNGRLVPHNLGSTPGCVFIKSTSNAENWGTFHRGTGTGNAWTGLSLNLSGAGSQGTPQSTVTSTSVGVTDIWGVSNSPNGFNTSGVSYVMYLFAHDAGGFPASGAGSTNGITCGAYAGTGDPNGPIITLGYEPQWVMIKKSAGGTISDGSSSWMIIDNLRGFANSDSNEPYLNPNLASAESGLGSVNAATPLATGFQLTSGANLVNESGATYIYIAIRRGPMKTPATGTSVFEPFVNYTSIANQTNGTMGPVDMAMQTQVPDPFAGFNWTTFDRLRGSNRRIMTDSTASEASESSVSFATNQGVRNATWFSGGGVGYNFKRAPGYMDVVCYTGTGAARTITHNLGVAPELVIVKARSFGTIPPDWTIRVPALGATSTVFLNLTDAAVDYQGYVWNNTNPTSTGVSLSVDNYLTNSGSGSTYVMYLFASCPGVSKVGSYTGTGATQVVNCGFTAGARLVLVKATSTTGNWLVWDSARGIVAGNDPYLTLNTTNSQVTTTDWVDTAATGFELSNAGGNLANTNGVSYIFLAIA